CKAPRGGYIFSASGREALIALSLANLGSTELPSYRRVKMYIMNLPPGPAQAAGVGDTPIFSMRSPARNRLEDHNFESASPNISAMKNTAKTNSKPPKRSTPGLSR